MAKRLDAETWKRIRDIWESDEREGFQWLVEEQGIEATRQSIGQRAKKEGWRKKKFLSLKLSQKKLEKVLEDEKTAPTTEDKTPLTPREIKFLEEYLSNGLNASKAGRAAGVDAQNAGKFGYLTIRKPAFQEALQARISERCSKLGIDSGKAIELLIQIVGFDANEVVSYIRYCCPACWSTNGREQLPLGMHDRLRDKWKDKEDKKAATIDGYVVQPFPYEVWDKRKQPNPDCSQCNGYGEGEVVYKDTRYLSPIGKIMYTGVSIGKGGPEILTLNKEKQLDNLLKILGLFESDQGEKTAVTASAEEIARIFQAGLETSIERQRAVNERRGLATEVEVIEVVDGKD